MKVQTRFGNMVDLANPQPEQIDLRDIAWHLTSIPRFLGATTVPWTVAHHSVLVHELCAIPEALFHDAAEAYIGDIPGPVKEYLGDAIGELEEGLATAIANKYSLVYPWPRLVRSCDQMALEVEATHFLLGGPKDLWCRQHVYNEDTLSAIRSAYANYSPFYHRLLRVLR